MSFKIDRSKAINSMLYIIESLNDIGIPSDIHKLMKLMYFADKDHLVKYGFPITGDTYIKLPYGTVPSFSNFVLKNENDDFRDIFTRSGYIISSEQKADLDDLSESEIESLNFSIDNFGHYTFEELTKISHGYAYESSDWDISYEKIAEEGGAENDMKAFIKEQILNDHISFS